MKNKILLLCSITMLVIACKSNHQSISNLKPHEFKSAFENEEGIILDVRTPQEISSGQIESASSINFYDKDFVKKIRKIQKDKVVYVYCMSGGRSAQAADVLYSEGQRKVVNLKGGLMAWKRANLPLTIPAVTKDESIQELSSTEFSKVLSSNQLVLVDFHTLWCSPCRKISPIIDELKDEYINSAHILRIDIDKSNSLADIYNIKAVPTLVLFKDEKELWRNTGLITKEELKDLLNKHLQD